MKDHSANTELLDTAIEAIRNDEPSATEMASATARVRAAIASRRGPPAVDSSRTESVAPAESWNSIADYVAAIPAYLAKQLSPAQTILFEEETRQSVPLRRALNEARGSDQSRGVIGKSSNTNAIRYRWLAAAATVAAVAIALVMALPQLPSLDQSRLAQVNTIDGELYQIANGQLQTLTPGTWIDGRQRIRSGNDSKAIITLDDGSQIEVDARSELSLTRRGSGNRIDVSRGRILVEASPQGSGTLDVFTNELEVSVTGTIFEVAHGAKGSRVAVVEGSVNVLLQGNTTSLEPGEMMGSRTDFLALNVADEVAWSQNAEQYLAMLEEVAALQQDLQVVMSVPPRYSTRLLDLVPADTAVYIAVPNAPEKVADVYEVIKARMQGSQFLSDAWVEFESASEGQHLDEVMAWMREIGYALGEETVFAMTTGVTGIDGGEEAAIPLVLSEVDAAAFTASFTDQIQRFRDALAAEGHDSELEVALIHDPAEAVDGQLSILLYEDLLVATIDAQTMTQMYEVLQDGSSAFVGSPLHGLLQTSYAQGTEILGAVDIPAMLAPLDSTMAAAEPELVTAGLHNAEFLIAQYQQGNNNAAIITADLFFAGPREGAMSWLATPGPMGSLEFFSADTTVVAALLLQEPLAILDALNDVELPADFDAQAELELFYSIMAVLGGEVAIGLDGPALPTPAWKAVIEAWDGALLQQHIESSVALINEHAAAEGVDATITLTAANVSGYSGYQVTLNVAPNVAPNADNEFNLDSVTFQYAYVDGYLVAAPNQALVNRAIGFYESGSSLPTNSEYRELMLRDGYLDYSAVYFSRLGQLLNDVLKNLPANITAEQQATIAALDTDIGPSMTSVLALPDKIHLAHSGSTQLPVQLLSQLAVLQPMLQSIQDQAAAVE